MQLFCASSPPRRRSRFRIPPRDTDANEYARLDVASSLVSRPICVLQGYNQLTSLPNGVFAGLTSLLNLELVRMQPLQLDTESLTEPLVGVCGAAASCLATPPYRTRLSAFSVLVCLAFAFPALVSFGLLPVYIASCRGSHPIHTSALASW